MASSIPVACFAPPLDDATLSKYTALVESQPASEVKDAMLTCLRCVQAWWKLPESKRSGESFSVLHRGAHKSIEVVPLEHDHIAALWDVTPWIRELNTFSTPNDDGPFDALPKGELRDAAFHLLWHAKEISLDREPLTNAVLK